MVGAVSNGLVKLAALQGWKRLIVAFLTGVAAAVLMPPFSLWPLLLVIIPIVIRLLDGCGRLRDAAAIGWWFGFGFFCAGLHWIAGAFLVDAGSHAVFIPLAIGGLSAGLAFFFTATFATAYCVWVSGHPSRVLALAGVWALWDWIRGWIFTGFPWNPLGLSFAPLDFALQPAALGGVFLLTLIAVVCGGLPIWLWDGLRRGAADGGGYRDGGERRTRMLAWAVPPLMLVVLVFVWGGLRLAQAPDVTAYRYDPQAAVDTTSTASEPSDEYATRPLLRLVQPSIPQSEKWDRGLTVRNMSQYVALSQAPGWRDVDAVVWGETAIPGPVNMIDAMRFAAARAAPPGGVLLTGGLRMSVYPDGQRDIWNSLFALDPQGRVRGSYDKSHLVPFGEYVPFRGIIPFDKVIPGTNDFSAGTGLETMRVSATRIPPFSPLICYEAIFPAKAVTDHGSRPEWLFNATNDGWYGHSTGPYQHLHLVRLRAIEEGLPLVRAANTGVSAVFDAFGRSVVSLGYNQSGFVDFFLPPVIDPPLFARYGNIPTVFLSLLFIFMGFLLRKRFVNNHGSLTTNRTEQHKNSM